MEGGREKKARLAVFAIRNREAGLCGCGRPRVEARSHCARCFAKHLAGLTERRRTRRAAGVCIECGGYSAGKKRCPEHTAQAKVWEVTGRLRRQAAGLCSECRNPAEPDRKRCKKHGADARRRYEARGAKGPAAMKALREARKAAGLCITCGKVPAAPERVRCAECAEAHAARNRAAR